MSKNKLIYYLYLIIYFISNCTIISKTEAEENNYESYIIQKYDTIESILIKKNLRPIYGKNGNIEEFIKLNKNKRKKNSHLIYPGEVVILPKKANYEVKKDEFAINLKKYEFSTSIHYKEASLETLTQLPEGYVYIEHTVKKGDMISILLKKYGASPIYGKNGNLFKTLELNPNKKPTKGDLIYPKEIIIIPILISKLKEINEIDRENLIILSSSNSKKTDLKKLSFKEFFEIYDKNKTNIPDDKKEIITKNKTNSNKIENSEIILKLKYDKNHIILNWKKRTTRKNYTYEILKSSYDEDNYQIIEKNIQSHFYEDLSIKDGMSYYYKIIGYDKEKNKIESNIEFIHTRPTPALNLISKLEKNKIILKWDEAKSYLPITYEVKRSLHSQKGYYSIKKGLTNLFFEDNTAKPGVKYYYIIKTFDTNDNYSLSNEVFINTSPNKIELNGYSKKEYIYLEWKDGKSKIPIKYDVLRSTSLNDEFKTIASNLKMKLFRDRAIERDNNYFYQIIGKNEDGVEIYSNIFSTKTEHSKIKLNISYENSEVHLNWNKNLGNIPLKYSVLRSPNNFNTYEVITENLNETEFIDKSALNGFQYFYKIIAENEYNKKIESNIVRILTKSNSVNNIKLNLIEKYDVEINWDKLITNSNYLYSIKRSYEKENNYETIAKNIKDNHFIDKKVKPGNEVFYIISAINKENIEVNSDIVSIITTPKDPIDLIAYSKDNSIFLSWKKLESNIKMEYEIFRSESPNFDDFILIHSSELDGKFEDKSILYEEKYIYKILVKCENLKSNFSEKVTIMSHNGRHTPHTLDMNLGVRYLTFNEYNNNSNSHAALYSAASPSISASLNQNWEDNLYSYFGSEVLYVDLLKSPIYDIINRQKYLFSTFFGVNYKTNYDVIYNAESSLSQDIVYESQGFNTMQDKLVYIINNKLSLGYQFFEKENIKALIEGSYILTFPINYGFKYIGNGYKGELKINHQSSAFGFGAKLFYLSRYTNTDSIKSNIIETGIIGEFSLELGYN